MNDATPAPNGTVLANKWFRLVGLGIVLFGLTLLIFLAIVNGGPLPGLVFGIGLLIVVGLVYTAIHWRTSQRIRAAAGKD